MGQLLGCCCNLMEFNVLDSQNLLTEVLFDSVDCGMELLPYSASHLPHLSFFMLPAEKMAPICNFLFCLQENRLHGRRT